MKNELMKNDLLTSMNTLQQSIDKLIKLLSVNNADDEKVKQAYDMFVKKDETPSMDSALEEECPVDDKVFGEEKSVDDCSILNLIPEVSRKWVDRLTLDEMIKAYNDTVDWGRNTFENDDAFISEFVDHVKDMAVAKYTNDILAGRISNIEDEEIKSEVIEYMMNKGMDIPASLLPKKSDNLDKLFNVFKSFKENKTTDPINEFITKLDKGETLELPNDILTQIIDRLWDTRENVNIEVHNNKIRVK